MIFIWIGYFIKDLPNIKIFNIVTYTTVIILTFYGWYNAIDITFKKADENWEFFKDYLKIT